MGDDDKIHYPEGVMFVLLSEFSERFCYNGIRTIATMYIRERLKYSEEHVNAILHIFVCIMYFAPMIGGMIADSCLGKYKTIILMTSMYIFGVVVLSTGTMRILDVLGQPTTTYVGLAIIAITSGAYKPCSSSFGGDQFVMPKEEVALSRFFSMFYFAISLGALLSITLAPEISKKVECLKRDSCYALAFGLPGLFIIAALVIFTSGKRFYTVVRPDTNIFKKFYGCIIHALFKKCTDRHVQKEHWLDYASDIYDQALISDVKSVVEVIILFMPLPLFWSLYEQQYNEWYHQARLMNGKVGNRGYTILPYQMQIANEAAVLILILLFDYIIYPILRWCNIGHPLQKMCFGGILTGITFLVSGAVSTKIEGSAPIPLPGGGYGQLRIYNTIHCPIDIKFQGTFGKENFILQPFEVWTQTKMRICATHDLVIQYKELCRKERNHTIKVPLYANKANGIYFYAWENATTVIDDIERHPQGMAKVRFLVEYHGRWPKFEVTIKGIFHDQQITVRATNTTIFNVRPDTYIVRMKRGKDPPDTIYLSAGGVYALLIGYDDRTSWHAHLRTVTPPRKVSILWQLPQNILLAAGEVMLVITGMEFAYTQAPKSMKAVMVAYFCITYAIGNLIVVVIASLQIGQKQSSQFYFYGLLMIVDMLIFACLSIRYRYVVVK